MTKKHLGHYLDHLQSLGLSPVLRAMAENAVLFCKWGDLPGWGKARIEVQNKVRKYNPELLPKINKLFNEA